MTRRPADLADRPTCRPAVSATRATSNARTGAIREGNAPAPLFRVEAASSRVKIGQLFPSQSSEWAAGALLTLAEPL